MPTDNPNISFRKKAYTIGTDDASGVITFDSEGKKIYLEGDIYGEANVDLYVEKTYSELKTMVDGGTLVEGQMYRITDYVTTTAQTDTTSANHAFDLVVTAISNSELDHRASAILHEGDTYFSTADADLSKWQIWYDINNDTTKYLWADSSNGKGVIYRMIDEWGNDCPYDFKNILFTVSGKTSNAYTFNVYSDSTCSDHSLNGRYCYDNIMEPYFSNSIQQKLNFNVFYNTSVTAQCNRNTFGNECYSNTFVDNCYSNTFGNDCHSNKLGYNCHSNTFGNSCYVNTFGYYCYSNTFEYNCYSNTFGNNCTSNTFGNICNNIVFGNSSKQYGTFVRYIVIENGNQYIRFYKSGTADGSHYLQNIYIAQGFNNTTSYKDISTIDRALTYRTTVAQLSDGTTRIYKEDEDDRNVQADWNQTDTSADDYILNKPDLDAILYVETTYSALKGMVDGGTLVEGQMYRITDYNTTTVQENTSVAGHQFDLVVTAISNSELDHRASAVLHEGDTYFSTAGADLSKWQIWYDIENNSTKYAWADSGSSGGAKSGELTVPEWIIIDSQALSNAGLSSVLVYQGIVEFEGINCYSYGTAEQADAVYHNCVTFVIPGGETPSTKEKVAVVDSNMQSQDLVPCSNISKTTVPVSGIREVPEYIVPKSNIYEILDKVGLSTQLPYNGTVSYMGNTCFSYGTPEQISAINDVESCTALIVQDGMIPIQELEILVLNSKGGVSFVDTIGSVSPKSIVVGGGATGVIYRMIDEWGNDCPYDFKNILFTVSGQTASAYTFNMYTNSTCSDYSLNGQYCYDNTMEPYFNKSIQQTLNFNVFYNTSSTAQCNRNAFGNECYSNTFGDGCTRNTFGIACARNTFGDGCTKNTFESSCTANIFGTYCHSNTFGDDCSGNTFGNECDSNIFENYCQSNTFGYSCQYNTFGNECDYNIFGNYCQSNTFGNKCNNIVFGNSSKQYGTYVRYVVVESGNKYIRLYKSGTADGSHYLQNIYIAQGFNNTNTYKEISTIDRALTYRTTVAQLSDGTTRIYKEDEDDRNVQADWNQTTITANDYIKNKPQNLSDFTNDSNYATESYVDTAIENLPEPMVFKGSLGTGGTITSLPAASSSNTGFVYKVITDGTYSSISAKNGDTFISSGTEWILIPSGDEPSGTVTSVGVSVPTGLSVSNTPVTSNGTIGITYASGYSIPTTAKQTEWDNKSDFSGSYTDLTNKPTIPTSDSGLTNDRYVRYDTASQGLSSTQKSNARTNIGAGTSSFSGSYNDLTNKPTIPDAQVQTDWNATTGMGVLLNKPTLSTVATSGSYNDLLNKPSIPDELNDLTDTTITSPSDGQVLKYNNATSKWINSNPEKEIFWCTMTSTTENGITTYSCDKTWAEIYAAYQAVKLPVLIYDDNKYFPFGIDSSGGIFQGGANLTIGDSNVFTSESFYYSEQVGWSKHNFQTYDFSFSDKYKLEGIAEGAEVNVQSDWNQTTTTADDYIKNKPSIPSTAADVNAIPTSEKGANNGVAELDSSGKVPSSQLPSYVDDVLEYASQSAFPATGESGKIYIAQDTNKTYRWSGSAYVEISESLALGETSSTAYRGDRGKTAYNHSQITNGSNPHNTTLDSLVDTTLSSVSDRQVLAYDSTTSKWINTDMHQEDIRPLASKTYTNVLRNNTTYNSPYTNSYLYFGNVKTTDLTKPSKIKYHIRAYAPSNASYLLDSIVEWDFSTDGLFRANYIWNNLNSTSYYPFAYHTLYNSNSSSISQSDGSYFGCYYGTATKYGQSPNTIARTIEVEILECENCTCTLNDNVVWFNDTSNMPANLVQTSTSEAYNTTNFTATNVSTGNGLQETGDANSNTIPTGYCVTAASTAAKSATCTYGYRGDTNYFPCLFRYANTAANATLKIDSYATTALPIYVNGARTSSSNTFSAGVIMFLYYNNAYWCYNDGRFPIVVNGTVTSIQDELGLYTKTAQLSTVATSGSYNDLTNTPTIPDELNDLTDTTIASPSNGQVLTYDSTTSKWVNETINSDELYIEKTYSELKSMVDGGTLVEGQMYRITDYVTTTSYSSTTSAGNAFDLVVTAISNSKLDNRALALLHSGDAYFSMAGADLSKWQIWYDINNDTSKYAWADSTNGKGVIYRMIDEWGNDCPYDFKNILFTVSGQTANAYTFNVYTNSTCSDHSLNGQYCYSNTMEPYFSGSIQQRLNFNVFYNTSGTEQCNRNTFGNGCYDNTFGNGCYGNTFGNGCYDNTFGAACTNNTFGNSFTSNTFGNSCYSNTFGNSGNQNTFGNNFYNNTFGDYCAWNRFGDNCNHNTFGTFCGPNAFGNYFSSNTFGNNCNSNTFGDYCHSNTIGNNCCYIGLGDNCGYNTFGDYCGYNTIGNNCEGNTFGNCCRYNTFGDSSNHGGDYVRYVIVENGNQYIRLFNSDTANNSNWLQNIYISQGVNNSTSYLDIYMINRAQPYRTTVANNSNGDMTIYNEADMW